VYAFHSSNNPASGSVLKKLGMKHEGTMRRHQLKWGEYLDIEIYGMLSKEWK
jgi:RimJ/RimL family protein N-acetyltransferase